MATRPDDRNPNQTSEPNEVLAGTTPRRRPKGSGTGGYQRQTIPEAAIKSFIRSIAGSLGRAIMRAIVGRR
jgi:hypothetical protein